MISRMELVCKPVEEETLVVTACPSYRGEGRALYTCRERATPSLITYVVIVQLVKISIPYSVMYSSAYVRIPCTDTLKDLRKFLFSYLRKVCSALEGHIGFKSRINVRARYTAGLSE